MSATKATTVVLAATATKREGAMDHAMWVVEIEGTDVRGYGPTLTHARHDATAALTQALAR